MREYDSKQGPVREVAIGYGDQAIAAVSDFGVKVLARSGLRMLGGWNGPPGTNSVAFDPDGQNVLVSSGGVTQIANLIAEPQQYRPLTHGAGTIARLALNPDGRGALITGADGITRLWDRATGRASGRRWPARKSVPLFSPRMVVGSPSRHPTAGSASGMSP